VPVAGQVLVEVLLECRDLTGGQNGQGLFAGKAAFRRRVRSGGPAFRDMTRMYCPQQAG
jgi:hypothetical protein